MEKEPCRGAVYLIVLSDHPTLFLYFLPFCYPYILLHFKCLLLLVKISTLCICYWIGLDRLYVGIQEHNVGIIGINTTTFTNNKHSLQHDMLDIGIRIIGN